MSDREVVIRVKELTKQYADAFIENMKSLGYEKDEVVKILADYISGSK